MICFICTCSFIAYVYISDKGDAYFDSWQRNIKAWFCILLWSTYSPGTVCFIVQLNIFFGGVLVLKRYNYLCWSSASGCWAWSRSPAFHRKASRHSNRQSSLLVLGSCSSFTFMFIILSSLVRGTIFVLCAREHVYG